MIYDDRVGETTGFTCRADHEWYWFPQQTPDEITILKCYDSVTDGKMSRWTFHTAFVDPTAPKDAPFQAFLTTPYARPQDVPGTVEPVYMQLAKKKASKEYDRVMYYWPFMNGLPMNTVASKLFGFNRDKRPHRASSRCKCKW